VALSAEPDQATAQHAVLAAFAEVLGLAAPLPAGATFFDLGGDSLRAMLVANRLTDAFGDPDPEARERLRADLLLAIVDEGTATAATAVLDGAASGGGQPAPAAPAAVTDDANDRLTPSERRLWLAHAMDPDSAAYHIVNAFEVSGPVDPDRLRRAALHVVARHEALRTTYSFAGEVATKQVQSEARVDFGTAVSDDLTEARAAAAWEARRPYDLSADPMLRVRLYTVAPERALLLIVVHHIAADGWSMRILFDELADAYAARVTPTPGGRTRVRASGLPAHAGVSWWREYLRPVPERLELDASARPRPTPRTFAGDVLTRSVPDDVRTGLEALARSHRTSLFVILLALFELTLHQRTGQHRFLVGTVTAGRESSDLEHTIGFFANTVPVAVDLRAVATLAEHIERVRRTWSDVLAHGSVPFEDIVRAVQPELDPARTPLLDAVLILQDPYPELRLHGTSSRAIRLHNGSAKFDLTLEVEPGSGRLALRWEWGTDVIGAAEVAAIADSFTEVARRVCGQPDAQIADLLALAAGDRSVVDGLVRPPLPAGDLRPIPRIFADVVARQPERIAIVEGANEITFAALDATSIAIAGSLATAGVGRGDMVALAVPRSSVSVAAFLAITRLGAVTVPLDLTYPAPMRAEALRQVRPAAVVVDGDIELPKGLSATAVRVEEAMNGPPHAAVEVDRLAADEALYVIFTSGSTGRPKGVIGSHLGLVNRCAWSWRTLPYAADEVVLARTPLGFVDSFSELICPLLAGVRIVIASDEDAGDIHRLTRLVASAEATRLLVTPSLLATMVDGGDAVAARLRGLQVLVASGEPLPAQLARQVRTALPRTRLINLYGSSEVAGDATWFEVPKLDEGTTSVPIGAPIAGTRIRVVGQHGLPLPPGVAGQLVIEGAPVALGYHGGGGTPSGFRTNARGRVVAFHTGDIGLVRRSGVIEHLGRNDHQVKVRGCRVEPAGVRQALCALPGVDDAAVLATGAAGQASLTAFVVGAGVDADELRRGLSQAVPGFMVPAAIHVVPALPRTANGKLDRARLIASAPSAPLHPAVGAVEQTVARIWADVLGLPAVGRDQHFFSVGGDSLRANAVVTRVMGALGVELTLRDFLRDPSVSGLAAAATRAGRRDRRPPAPDARATEPTDDLTDAQRQLWFFEQLAPAATSYHVPLGVWLDGPLRVRDLERALREVVGRHRALRQVFAAAGGQPTVTVRPSVDVDLAVHDAAADEAALRAAETFVALPFGSGRLRWRAAVWRVTGERHLLVLVFHHLIVDGTSLWLLADELARAYAGTALVDDTPPAVDAPRRDRATAVDHVAERLRPFPAVLDLRGARVSPAVRSHRGGVVGADLPEEVAAGVLTLAERFGTTPAAVTLAAYATVLEAASGSASFVISVPVADRLRPGTDRAIGFFVNSVPAPLDLAEAATFEDALRIGAGALAFVWEHHDVPFADVVRAMNPERLDCRNPLCQVEYAYQVVPAHLRPFGTAEARYVFLPNGGAKFDLSLDVIRTGDRLSTSFEYATELLDGAWVRQLSDMLQRVLRQAVADPGIRLDAIALTAARPVPPAPPADDVVALLESRLASAADRSAVVSNRGRLSYAQLDERSAVLAAGLARLGIGPGDRVGVLLPRDIDAVVAIVAALRRGAAFVCLPDDAPPQRTAAMVAAARPRVVVTDARLAGRLPPGTPRARRDGTGGWVIDLVPAERVSAPPDEAYVAFTSGSTGTPRGVSVGRRGLAVIAQAWAETYRLREDPGCHLQVAPMSFDVFVGDLVRALCFGGTLLVVDRDETMDPAALVGKLRRATIGELVPALARLVVEFVQDNGLDLGAMRQILVGSDVWGVDECRELLALCRPGTRIICSYGTTETTIDSTYYEVHADRLPPAGPVPIGSPFRGVVTSIRDARGRELPSRLWGELWIGGATVGNGYVNADDAGFVSDARSDGAPATRWYRTGDLVALHGDDLVCHGRLDRQVKLRGVRLEPAEVEARLREHPSVAEAAVVPLPGGPDPVLAAFVIADGRPCDPEALREHLATTLPAAAIPTRWHAIETLPLTASGKVDRRALPALAFAAAPAAPARPTTPLEQQIVRIWSSVLECDVDSVDADFFDLGGHSLQACRLAWRLREAIGRPVGVENILSHRTPRRLARWLDGGGPSRPEARTPEVMAFSAPVSTVPAAHPPRSVVLTGATGYIGSHILAELLRRDVTKVHAVVRAADARSPRDRLAATLARNSHDSALAYDPRLAVLTGDLALPGLSLAASELATLEDADAIVNAGAWVNFLLPYEWLVGPNVAAVYTLATLAARSKRSALHHVSTQSAVTRPREAIAGGYNQSKAAAEGILADARAAGLRVSLYRPGFVCGPSREDGATPPGQLLWSFLTECVDLGAGPALDGVLDIVPVDAVAAAVVDGVFAGAPSTRNLVNPWPMRWVDVFAAFTEAGFPIQPVTADDWLIRWGQARPEPARSHLEPFRTLVETAGLDNLFAQQESVPVTPWACPPVEALLPWTWRHMTRAGLLPATEPAAVAVRRNACPR
jgi:amino acid adenylation domain-containing protein/thioester reductase-like protein